MRSCNYCDLHFDDKSTYSKHVTSCKPQIQVSCGNGSFTVIRNSNGVFICQCAHPDCPRPFQTDNGLLKHLKTTGHDWQQVIVGAQSNTSSEVQGEEETTVEVDSGRTPQLVFPVRLCKQGLCINVPNQLLVCIACQVALEPPIVQTHLHKKHGLKGSKTSQVLVLDVCQEYGISSQLPIVSNGPVPEIKGLQMHFKALKCAYCPRISNSRRCIIKHSKSEHPLSEIPDLFKEVTAQRLSRKPGHNTYFEVVVEGEVPLDLDVATLREQCDASYTAHKTTTLDPRTVSPWLLTTRWHEHISKYDWKHLRRLVQRPGTTEEGLYGLKKAVLELMEHGVGLLPNTTTLVLQVLHSPDPMKKGITNTPFHELQVKSKSLSNYSRRVTGLLAFLLRAHGEYTIPLPDHVNKLLSRLRCALVECAGTRKLRRRIQKVLIVLWSSEWPPCVGSDISDPTIRYLALSTINADGTYAEPFQVTNPISSFEYCMRLSFLYEMHLRVENKKNVSLQDACDALSCWFTEKRESTFNTLRTLQHRATALAQSSLSMPRVSWLERNDFNIMSLDGDIIDLSLFPTMFRRMEQDMVELWQKKLLCGLDIFVTYEKLSDNLRNNRDGYSFLVDPKNKCFRHRDRLADVIVKDPALASKFLTNTRGPDGRYLWNVLELRRWLLDYTNFHTILMTRIEMTAGAPERGTQLTCLEYCNTKHRQGRGLYAMGNYIAILCRYHKSQNITTLPKLIPHALDAFCASLIVQDLAIARPFAELAVHLCFPDRLDIQSSYRTHLFTNNGEPFQTDDLTKTMCKYTLPALGCRLGISDWRHVSVAFRRKHCPLLLEMVDRINVDTVQALQAGHSIQTENQIYGLGELSTALGGERPLEEFLDASIEWQGVCNVICGGVFLPYIEAITEESSLRSNTKRKRKQVTPLVDLSDAALERIADLVITKMNGTLLAGSDSVEILLGLLLPKLEERMSRSVRNVIVDDLLPMIARIVAPKRVELDTENELTAKRHKVE